MISNYFSSGKKWETSAKLTSDDSIYRSHDLNSPISVSYLKTLRNFEKYLLGNFWKFFRYVTEYQFSVRNSVILQSYITRQLQVSDNVSLIYSCLLEFIPFF